MLSTNKQSGFTLMELMIVIAVIGILASVAMPAYTSYIKKARFSEVVIAASSFKGLVDVCYQIRGGTLSDCDTVAKIGGNVTEVINGPNVATLTYSTNAVITVTGNATSVDGRTYILTPTSAGGTLTWAQSGDCVSNGLC